MKIRFVLIIFTLMVLAGTGGATDYYVATWGNNASAGTLVAPWQNISYAAQQAIAGDTIFLINGTWYDEYAIFANSGNSTHKIRITKYNGTPTMEALSPETNVDIALKLNQKTNITIDNITFIRYYTAINAVMNVSNILIENINVYTYSVATGGGNPHTNGLNIGDDAKDISISNSTFTGDAWNAINLGGRYLDSGTWYNSVSSNISVNNVSFFNNTVHGALDLAGNMTNLTITNITCNRSNLGCIYNHQGFVDGVIIENSNISNQDYEAIYFDGGGSNITIRYNNITNVTNSGSSNGVIRIHNDTLGSGINNNISGNTIITDAPNYIIYIHTKNSHASGNNISGSSSPEYYLNNENVYVQDEVTPTFQIASVGWNAIVNYTSNYVFSVDAGSTKYYQDRSEATISAGTLISITKYNDSFTIQPSSNNVTITNTSSVIAVNYQSNSISRLNISTELSRMINLSGLPQTNYSLYYANGTLKENKTASSNKANFSSVPTGSYYITEVSDAPAVPATPNTVRNRYYTQSCNDILTIETFFFAIFGIAIICIVTFSSLDILKGKNINIDFLIAAVLLVMLGLVVMTTIPFLIELIEC